MQVKPSYYAVIPSEVRYAPMLPPNAKLLYGEISALCNAEGICTTSNEFFAQAYGFTERSVRNLIATLETEGFICTQTVRDEKTGQISGRMIALTVALSNVDEIQRKKFSSGGKDFPLARGKNFPPFIRMNNIYISPKAPQGGDACEKPKRKRRECKDQADTLPERFEKFWSFYRASVPEGRTAGNRQAALRAWDKLSPTDALVTEMATKLATQVKTEAWKSGIGVPHASTWLNNRGWDDDWGAPDASTAPAEESEGDAWWLT